MRTSIVFALIALFNCAVQPAATTMAMQRPTFPIHGAMPLADGDADEGKATFTKLRCDSCHSINGKPGAPHPLPDLTAEPAEAVAAMIVGRTTVPPGAIFDEMAMASAASWLTEKQLADVVAYLRRK